MRRCGCRQTILLVHRLVTGVLVIDAAAMEAEAVPVALTSDVMKSFKVAKVRAACQRRNMRC